MKNVIEAVDLCKDYGRFRLDGVSLSVPGGSIVGLIGENGAGKSTTLKCLLGLVRPDGGEVRILGRAPEDREVREQLGVVFDECRFHGSLTPVELGGILSKLYRSWDGALWKDYLDKFQLPGRQQIKGFSRGMGMKLSIAAALAHRPLVLFLDEATSGLDPVVREEILDEFLAFVQDEDHGILASSHITSDLEKAADYITYLHLGRVVLQGEKDVLLERYGRVACSEAELAQVDPALLAARRVNRFGAEALVRDRTEFRRRYPDLPVDPVGLDDIMVFTTKGESV